LYPNFYPFNIGMGPENTNLVYRKTHQDASKIRAEGRKDGKTSKMIKETESTTFTPQTAQHDENVLPSSVSAHSAEDDSTTILSDPESEEYHETVSLKKRKAKQQTIDEAVPKRTLRSSMKKIPTSVTEQDEQAAAEYGTRRGAY
jgi:hypothetical protein